MRLKLSKKAVEQVKEDMKQDDFSPDVV